VAAVGDEPLGALRLRGERPLTPGEHELVEVCTQLIALQLLRERAALQSELRVHSEFLDDLLEGRLHDRHGLLGRAALLGFDLRAPHYIVCVGLHAGPATDRPAAVKRRTLTQVEQYIRAHFEKSIVVPRRGDLVVLLATGRAEQQQVHEVLRGMVRVPPGVGACLAAGIGRLCIGLDDYADSYAEAQAALDLARRRDAPGEVLSATDLGFYGLLVRGPSRHSLESIVEGALGPLLEADASGGSEYVRSLEAYLANDRHLERTAAALHVHPNTVRYRLAKVQELLGINLRDVDDRFLLELALRVQAAL
jgi:sugar diacid utilization regulator